MRLHPPPDWVEAARKDEWFLPRDAHPDPTGNPSGSQRL